MSASSAGSRTDLSDTLHLAGEWVLLGGGPGLPVSYLEKGLRISGQFRAYQHPGESVAKALGSHITSIRDIVEDLRNFLDALHLEKVNFICHSWGCCLLLDLCRFFPSIVGKLVMISPMPLVLREWQRVEDLLDSRMGYEVLDEISKKNGSEVMDVLNKFYCKKPIPAGLFEDFDAVTCEKIIEMMGEFDYAQDLKQKCEGLEQILWILGDGDPLWDGIDAREVLQGCGNIEILDDVGHYPFFEDWNQFKKVIQKHALTSPPPAT